MPDYNYNDFAEMDAFNFVTDVLNNNNVLDVPICYCDDDPMLDTFATIFEPEDHNIENASLQLKP
jgi:hypothetical protein